MFEGAPRPKTEEGTMVGTIMAPAVPANDDFKNDLRFINFPF